MRNLYRFTRKPYRRSLLLLAVLLGLLPAVFNATATTHAQGLPAWTKSERKDIKKNVAVVRGLYLPAADDYGVERQAGKQLKWFTENRAVLMRQKVVYHLVQFYFGAGGFNKADEETNCEHLAKARQYYLDLDPAEGEQRRLISFLKTDYNVDAAFFTNLYQTWYPEAHNLLPGESCGAEVAPEVIAIEEVPDSGVVPARDTDGDGVIDADDDCPLEAGLPVFEGCPREETFTAPDGSVSVLTPTESYYVDTNGRHDVPQDIAFLEMLGKGAFNTDHIRLDQVQTGSVASGFEGADYVLLELNLIDSSGHQVIRFPTSEYVIDADFYPTFHQDFRTSFTDFLRCLDVVQNFFGLTTNDFRILVQGIADSPEIKPCKPLHSGDQSDDRFMRHECYTRDRDNDRYVRKEYVLDDACYDNDDLPYLRGKWLYHQIATNLRMARHNAPDYLTTLEGKVLTFKEENLRCGVLYLLIDRRKLKAAAQEKNRKLAAELNSVPARAARE